MSVSLPVLMSSATVLPVDKHFRIYAGPGAGKTHWLVNHIQHVIQHSPILGRSRKIACITYTNIAVNTIIRRLDFIADRVEVSTIHGFLYHNVVKPYVSFISADYDLDAAKIDGHDDFYPGKTRIKEWLNSHRNISNFKAPYTLAQMTNLPNNLSAIGNWLSSIFYELGPNGIKIKADNGKASYVDNGVQRNLGVTTCLNKLEPGLWDFKKIYWRLGILHHDDILFFSYLLFTRFPFVLRVIRAKFPYFFIDEFQDTSPVQAAILKLIGGSQIMVGIIGDKAQSIFSFQGAQPQHFENFSLPGLVDYFIPDNRRSTTAIVDVLNSVRKDIVQKPVRNEQGVKSILYVGDKNTAVAEAMVHCNGTPLTTLAWDNITSNAMKRRLNAAIPSIDLNADMSNHDTDSKRRKAVISCVNAVELARQKRFKEAIKEMERNFRETKSKPERKRVAFKKLQILLSEYHNFYQLPLIDFYQLVNRYIVPDLSAVRGGAPKKFYSSNIYEQLAVCVKIAEDDSPNRTIHKAKGDEFPNVLLILKDESNLAFLLNSNLPDTESHRLYYVAISRAKDNLYISVPELDAEKEKKLEKLFEVKRI